MLEVQNCRDMHEAGDHWRLGWGGGGSGQSVQIDRGVAPLERDPRPEDFPENLCRKGSISEAPEILKLSPPPRIFGDLTPSVVSETFADGCPSLELVP